MIDSHDVLSEALQCVRPRSWIAEEQHLNAPGELLGDGAACVFYHVIQGCCRLQWDAGETGPKLTAGDLAVIMPGVAHTLRAAPERESPPESVLNSGIGSVRLVSGGLQFGCDAGHLLPALLPALIVVNGVDGQAAPWLADILRCLAREAHSLQPGRQAVIDHLLQLVFIQAVRAALAAQPVPDRCGLRALLDPDIGPALQLMHADPHLPWTVGALADRVGMSRSAFAARFKTLVAKAPLQYLLEYRMEKARTLLNEGHCGLKQIATQVGYATGGTFSNAFKRWCGTAPGAYRRGTLAAD